MSEQRIGIIMNGVTGRMGTNQHLVRSINAIRAEGGVPLADGRRVMPDPILVGRDARKLEALAPHFFAQEGYPAFQHVAGADSYDTTAENPLNRVFTEGNLPLFGGLLSVPILMGVATSPSAEEDTGCGDA